MEKKIARILALGVAVALPTGLFAQSQPAKPVDKPETTAPASSTSTETKNLETKGQPGKKSARKAKKSAKKGAAKKSDGAKPQTTPSSK